MSIFTKILRAGEGKKVRALASIVPDINALEPELERLSDDDLAHKTVEFRERLDHGEDLNDLLVEAFAVVREAAKRTIGQRHFDVQLMGGAALHFGWIAEMKTGEGKTLVVDPAGLPQRPRPARASTSSPSTTTWPGATPSGWARSTGSLGITVGRVSPEIDDWQAKKDAYACDVTYGTNTEFGFDYLRDNMARSLEHMVQRGHPFAIVDEVDSILIDEARTPLIISGPSTDSVRLYYQFAGVARSLTRDADYEVDEEKRTVAPTEEGIEKVERQLGLDNLYDLVSANLVHQLTQALRAKELYKRDKDYIVQDGEVKIVDEFTGRILDGRRWSDGLHQAVEAKERVKIKEENHTWATVTLQNYFRLYEKLAGMTGTAETEASEFANTYNLPVVPIPTNMPMVRADQGDLIYKTELAKFEAVVEDLVERYDKGQPVLVGTASVEKSEVLSAMLEKRGIPHNVLNAKQHAREAQHRRPGRPAARRDGGDQHGRPRRRHPARRQPRGPGRPGGHRGQGLDPESEEGAARYRELLAKYEDEVQAEGDKVRELGGLYVLGSERHESRRIDNQLRGRAGRQGDPGESRFYLSLEDELMRLFATGAMNWVMGKALPDDVPIEAKMVTKAIERAQNTVEARNAEIRKDVLKYDEVMNEQRKVIYARRRQILDGEDLRARTLEVLVSALESIVTGQLPGRLHRGLGPRRPVARDQAVLPDRSSPPRSSAEAQRPTRSTRACWPRPSPTTTSARSPCRAAADTMRALEREVMLQIIDQKWREHLSEMDYLREGINLRAMGQQDPLVEWQREGYDDVRPADVGHRRRLRQDRHARPGPGARAGRADRRRRPGRRPVRGGRRPGAGQRRGPAGAGRRAGAGRGGGAGAGARWRRAPTDPAARRPSPTRRSKCPWSRTRRSTGPGATTRARAAAARSSSSATGARSPHAGGARLLRRPCRACGGG